MIELSLSPHAERRMNQRGLSRTDIALIRDYGAEVEGGFLLTEKACRNHIAELKRKIARLEHLKGKRIVCDEGTIVTAYHVRPAQARRILRRTAQRDLEITQ